MTKITSMTRIIRMRSVQKEDCGLWTADHGLLTGYKTRTRYKMGTRNYRLSIKHGLGIKHRQLTVYILCTALER